MPAVVAAVLVLAALAVGAWFVVGRLSAITVAVNGQQVELKKGATVQELLDKGYAAPQPGNLLAIDGSVYTPGGGTPYTATVNGAPVDGTYALADGEQVSIGNGTDVVEDATVTEEPIPHGWYDDSKDFSSYWAGSLHTMGDGRDGVRTVRTGSVSGITQAEETVAPVDGGYRVYTAQVDRPVVALTFDDGPDPDYTPQYLDILAQHGAKATFFNLGSAVEAGPEYAALSRRCAEEGHQVASHTYGHLDLVKQSAEGVRDDLDRAFAAVSEATGVPTNVMRPPYGNFYGSTFLEYLRAGGDIAYSAYWGVDSEDWRVATNGSGVEDGAQQIIANCTVGLTADSYNGAIVLMHDSGGNRDRDVAALPGLIEAYRSYGYELVTMNELLAACGTFPEWVVSGHAVRPEGAQLPGEATETVYYDPYTFDPMAPDGGTE